MAHEEPLRVVETRINIMWEVIQEDCGNSRGSVVREGEAPLRHGRCGSVHKRALGAENRDISRDWGNDVHRGPEVFASRGGSENIIGVDGNVFVKRGKKEGIEDFLSYTGGCRGHGRRGRTIETVPYNALRPGFLRGILGWLS